jgi:hypothetical protein
MNCEPEEENGLMHLVFLPYTCTLFVGHMATKNGNTLQSEDISALFVFKLMVKSGGPGIN